MDITIYKRYLPMVVLSWTGFLILSLVIYGIFLDPQNSKAAELERELIEKRSLYEEAKAAAQEQVRRELKSEVEKLRDKLGAFVVNEERSAELTFVISNLARAQNIEQLPEIKRENEKRLREDDTQGKISEDIIEVSFLAGFNDFGRFLNSLERHRPVIFVNAFRIINSNRPEQNHKINLDLSVFVKSKEKS